MNKFNRKMHQFLKKTNIPFMCISFVFIVFGFMFKDMQNILFTIASILCGFPIVYRAYSGLMMKAFGIEVLVTIACVGAFVVGEIHEAAIVTFLFQFGSFLEQQTIKKTRNAIKMLTEMQPSIAYKVSDFNSDIEEVDIDEVDVNDLLFLRVGNQVPVDGVIVRGEGYFNEAEVTGESLPVHKKEKDLIYAGTFVDSGTLYMQALKVGEDTTFSKIVALVEEAQDAKSEVEKFIDRFAKWYTPFVLIMAVGVYLLTKNIDTAITCLVLACPGALVIGAPVANVAGIGQGARNHILLKGGESVNTFSKTDTFVFDKTGTLTLGHPEVTSVYYLDEDKILTNKLILSLETISDHPLAKAIQRYFIEEKVEIKQAEILKGLGIKGYYQDELVLAGNEKLLKEYDVNTDCIQNLIEKVVSNGESLVILSKGNKILLVLGISDKIKDDAYSLISELRKCGISEIIMLSGDHQSTADLIAKKLKMDKAIGGLLPQDKLKQVQLLMEQGKNVAFVGDGINDSPALAYANTGIAIGSGTDVAIETSDVVLVSDQLMHIVDAFKLAKRTVTILKENIIIAIGTVIALLSGLVAGVIHMGIGMFIHEASILVVILNAMRLFRRRK